MTQLPDDDRPLIAFLKYYRPTPPPGAINLETQLMAKVKRESFAGEQRFYRLVGFFVTMIATSLLLSWGISRWLQPSPSIATNSKELEAFLVDSWDGTVGESSAAFSSHPVTSELLLLNDTDTDNNPNP